MIYFLEILDLRKKNVIDGAFIKLVTFIGININMWCSFFVFEQQIVVLIRSIFFLNGWLD